MKKTIFNFRWLFFILTFSVLSIAGVLILNDEEGISICVIVAGIIFILGYACVMPNRYTFSADGITVIYCFRTKTFLKWSDIKHMEECYAGGQVFPWWIEYEIGYFNTRIIFHQTAMIPKNKKVTEQINRYYGKTSGRFIDL